METRDIDKDAEQPLGIVDELFGVGAHFGYSKSKRHPSAKDYIFGAKNKIDIIDLTKTKDLLDEALRFVENITAEGGQILFVGGKNESREIIKNKALRAGMPYVSGRWIGGTLTNFPEIRKRVERLEDLTTQKEKGELAKYTKKERLLIDREIEKLEQFFGGLLFMKALPKALFTIDSKREKIAVAEARSMGIPVVSLSSTDCNLSDVEYPIIANDTNVKSIEFFANKVAEMCLKGAERNKQAETLKDTEE